MFREPIMWYGTSRNFLSSTQPCLATDLRQSSLARTAGLCCKIRCSTAMKCDLPAPKLPCR